MPETGDQRHPSFFETQKNQVGYPPLFPPPPFRERRPPQGASKSGNYRNDVLASSPQETRLKRLVLE